MANASHTVSAGMLPWPVIEQYRYKMQQTAFRALQTQQAGQAHCVIPTNTSGPTLRRSSQLCRLLSRLLAHDALRHLYIDLLDLQ